MQRVDFYIVETEAEQGCEAVACKLAHKAWAEGLRLYIRTAHAQQAKRLDLALWTFRQDSFLPHAIADGENNDPILIGVPETPAPDNRDMLINLAPELADTTAAYKRIAEVACRSPDLLNAARDRFRWYKGQGLFPENHVIAAPRGR